jgi:para-nitrobenzyl esterase
VYRYFFSYVPQNVRGRVPGAAHSDELKYVFGNFGRDETLKIDYTFAGKSIAAVVQRYWTTFAKTGNPNRPIVLSWPQDKIDSVLVLDSSGQHSAGRFPQTTARLCSSEIPRLIGMRENRNRWTAEGVDV